MTWKFLIFILLISTQAWGQTSYVSKTQTLAEGGSELLFQTEYFLPTIHSNPNGTLVQFEEGETYQSADINLNGSYGFTNRLQATIGVRFRAISQTQVISNEDTLFTKSGLESTMLSLKYSFPMEEGMQYAFEANYRAATYSNDPYTPGDERTTVALGDGGTDLSIGMGVSYYTKSQNFFSGRFLYRNPAETLSSEIFSEIEGAIVWPYFTALVGIENIYSLAQDPYATDQENKPDIDNGFSEQYNSINRSWTAPYIGMHIALGSRWRLEFNAKSKLYGNSTDLGNIYTLSLVRRNSKKENFKAKDAAFKEYKYEGSVTKITKNRSAVVVSIGIAQGIKKGEKVDFYHFDYIGGNQLIASGYAIKVGLRKSIVKITKRYSKLRVEEGTLARSGLIRN